MAVLANPVPWLGTITLNMASATYRAVKRKRVADLGADVMNGFH